MFVFGFTFKHYFAGIAKLKERHSTQQVQFAGIAKHLFQRLESRYRAHTDTYLAFTSEKRVALKKISTLNWRFSNVE